MDESILSKYSTQKKKEVRPPRSELEEQVNRVVALTGSDYMAIYMQVKHLEPYQLHRLYEESHGKPQFWWTKFREKYAKNNMEAIIKQKLEKFPEFRERKNRGTYLVILALRECGLEEKQKKGVMMTMNELSKFAIKYDSYRNAWGTVTRNNIHLQGSDYLDGERLEENVLREKGYRN